LGGEECDNTICPSAVKFSELSDSRSKASVVVDKAHQAHS
jgi:hypothetical protein